jgi:hypothetical protein
MSILPKHFKRLAKLQRGMEDEIHRMHEEGHIKNGQGDFMVNLSDDVHSARIGIERTKFLLGVEEMKLDKILAQKTTWAGIALIVTMALPQFGVPANIVEGVRVIVMGLAVIFLRQSVAKATKDAIL